MAPWSVRVPLKYLNPLAAKTLHTGAVAFGATYPASDIPENPAVAPLDAPRQATVSEVTETRPLLPPDMEGDTAAGKPAPADHMVPPPPPPPGPVQSLMP